MDVLEKDNQKFKHMKSLRHLRLVLPYLNFSHFLTALGLLAGLELYCQAAQLPIVSSFDQDADGWSVVELPLHGPYSVPATNYPPVFVSASGNSNSYIEFSDKTGNDYYFDAPAKFLGDQSSAYGLTLEFRLKITGLDYIMNTDPSVVLIGNGMVIVNGPGPDPTKDQWTHFSISLHEQAGWRKDTLQGAQLTESEFKMALSSLTALRIRGEYIFGNDSADLDDVILGAGFNGITNLMIRTAVEVAWSSQSNVLYQIQWASQLDTNSWFNFGGLIMGTGATNSAFDSTWCVPKRFYRVLRLE